MFAEAKDEAFKEILKFKLPLDGGIVIGDLTKSGAIKQSARPVHMAHLLNQAIPLLAESKLRGKKRQVRG